MSKKSANGDAVERLYTEIKARAISGGSQQDRQFYPESIAKEVGISTTEVDEALPRLIDKGLVITMPEDGFISVCLSEESVMGKYTLTRDVLSHELEQLEPATPSELSKRNPLADTLKDLGRVKITDGDVLATYTGEIFLHIASLRNNPNAMSSIENANVQLRYVRTLECRDPERMQKELWRFCDLLLAGRYEKLVAKIRKYHNRRIKSLPELLKRLRP